MTVALPFNRTLSMGRRGRLDRRQFRAQLLRLLGNDRAIWFPTLTDTVSSVDPGTSTGTWTPEATMAGQITAQGRGATRAFNGTTRYLTRGDAAGFSFGNGVVDTAMGWVALLKATANGANRHIFTKWGVGGVEYAVRLAADGTLVYVLSDTSTGGQSPSRTTNAAVTQGSYVLLGGTYSAATGGATAANDITLYENGAVKASTATNAAGYVAMEDGTAPLDIGAILDHGTITFAGDIPMLALTQKNLSAADHSALFAVCHQFFGAP